MNKSMATDRSCAEVEAELRALREALEESEAFSAALSHELRSPIGAISILGTLLEKEFAHGLDDSGRELLQRLNDCSRNMVKLMVSLALYSRARKQELNRVPLDMKRAMEAAFREQAAQAGDSARARLVLGELPSVSADQTLMHQLLASLFSNAIKCTASSQEPLIEVGGEVDGDEVRFTMRDNGVGFESSCAARLFAPFERVHSQAELPGFGLGLALVQLVARRHGGRAWAEGTPGGGAAMHVALPRHAPQLDSAARLAE